MLLPLDAVLSPHFQLVGQPNLGFGDIRCHHRRDRVNASALRLVGQQRELLLGWCTVTLGSHTSPQ